jgi:hypothetical protein
MKKEIKKGDEYRYIGFMGTYVVIDVTDEYVELELRRNSRPERKKVSYDVLKKWWVKE